MKLSTIQQNVEAAEEGVWIEEVYEGLSVKVARNGNRAASKLTKALFKPHQAQYERNKSSVSDKIFEGIQLTVLCQALIKDWKGLEDDEGNEIPFSPEKAREILSDDANRDFREVIQSLTEEQEVFRARVVETTQGE